MGKTVRDVLAAGGGLMALDTARAADLLATAWPAAAAEPQALTGDLTRYTRESGLAVMPVRGLLTPNSALLERCLGWATYRGIAEACAELASDAAVSAVVVEFDTPGGYTLGIGDAVTALRDLAAVKPVHALAAPLAASAGYWLASQARELVMTPGAAVGSIGVAVTAAANVAPGAASGVQLFDFTSRHARAKWPDPATEDGQAEIRRGLDRTEARFHAAVAAGRGIAPEDLAARLSVSDDPEDGGAVFDPRRGAGARARRPDRDPRRLLCPAAGRPCPRPPQGSGAGGAGAGRRGPGEGPSLRHPGSGRCDLARGGGGGMWPRARRRGLGSRTLGKEE
ncbi:S49 family peptidase [Rhodobacter capsulatus]|uniref:S49 family peptidase n=1 Tax=Rhodobacter capsulatus TaxID=1061 RepID=UPI004027F1C7